MDTISFSDIPTANADALVRTFELIKSGKERGEIDEAMLREALGEHINQFISDPDLIQQLLEKWQKDRGTPLPWEFGSWVDALANSELLFHSLTLDPDGSGQLHFEQLAWPSGGLEATEEIIKVFSGRVVSNSAI